MDKMNMRNNKKGMGFFGSIIILVILGLIVFSFAVIMMKKVTDYGKEISEPVVEYDPDYMKGATMEEKKEMIKNLTIAPDELAG